MMARGLALRVVAGRGGWMPGWSEMHSCSYALSEAQVQAFEPEPG